MIRQDDIQGFVLAGGKSRRMGRDKASIQWEGKSLVSHVVEVLRPFVREVTVLGPPERYSNLRLPVLADRWIDRGPLSALCTGLLHSTCDWNIFLACDLPLLSKRFLQLLVDRIQTTRCDVVAPHTEDGWHPLCAAYHVRCRPVFERAVDEKRNSIVALFEEVSVEAMTPDQMTAAGLDRRELVNMNTPEDWERVTGALNPSRKDNLG